MPGTTSRALVGGSAALMLVFGAVGVGPALAEEPPPLVWSMMPGYPQTDAEGVTVTWERAESTTSPFNGKEMLDPMPVLRPEVVNGSEVTKHFAFGTDFVAQGTIDSLWLPSGWGAFAELAEENTLPEMFWFTLPPGGAFSTADGSAAFWYDGMPSWSGHSITVFELSEPPTEGVTPEAEPVASVTTPGRFVPADLSDGDIDNLSAVLGQRATVAGADGAPELFPGVTATVEASALPPGETLELWIAKGMNYAFFQLLGGGLPVEALKVGEGTVAADGSLQATVTLPGDLTLGSYQLVAGVRAERYWPAGSYDDFHVTAPTASASAPVATGAVEASIDLGLTQVSMEFPGATSEGSITAAVSPTGPVPGEFTLASDPPLYYHLDSSADLGGPVTVCITYPPGTLAGGPPRLYHFDTAQNRWSDITTTSTDGQVCGLTSSFSPFALGYPVPFDFEGFFDPVSMSGPNVAKAGQAIPLRFSLGGDQGLDVVTSARFLVGGTAANPTGEALDAVTAGRSGLSYDASTDSYTYVWKSQKSWALKAGRFVMELSDGTTHEFAVSFTK